MDRDNPPIEYFAGLFDGEGSVSIMLAGGSARPHQLHVLVAVLAMCHEDAVRALHRRFGGDVRRETRREAHWKICWRWRVSGKRAADFLEEIEPYLIVKREQAQVGAEFFREKKRYKTLPIEERRKRESYRQRMWQLNGGSTRLRHPFDLLDDGTNDLLVSRGTK